MTDVPRIVSIIEGQGEKPSVPILIGRISADLGLYVDGYKHVLTKRDRFPRFADERERLVAAARVDAGLNGAILIVLDSDGEPPCRHARRGAAPCLLGVDLLEAVLPLVENVPTAVVWAECEYEAWFVAAAPSLIGEKGLAEGVEAPNHPDRVGDAKGWLSRNMRDGRKYAPTADQARFTAQFDMQMARERSPSFDRCYREIERLIRAVTGLTALD